VTDKRTGGGFGADEEITETPITFDARYSDALDSEYVNAILMASVLSSPNSTKEAPSWSDK